MISSKYYLTGGHFITGGSMSLSANLIRLRDREGWSQEQLAEKIGVSRSTVAKWESGKGIPKIENLVVLCDIFQVSIDSIIRQ